MEHHSVVSMPSWWQCHHNTWKTSAGLWRSCNVNSTKWAVQQNTISKMDMWQHSMVKRTCLIQSKINSQNDCWWSEHEPGYHLFDTDWRIWDEKYLCHDGVRESHRVTVGITVERSFLHPNALRLWCSLLIHLILDLKASLFFKK